MRARGQIGTYFIGYDGEEVEVTPGYPSRVHPDFSGPRGGPSVDGPDAIRPKDCYWKGGRLLCSE